MLVFILSPFFWCNGWRSVVDTRWESRGGWSGDECLSSEDSPSWEWEAQVPGTVRHARLVFDCFYFFVFLIFIAWSNGRSRSTVDTSWESRGCWSGDECLSSEDSPSREWEHIGTWYRIGMLGLFLILVCFLFYCLEQWTTFILIYWRLIAPSTAQGHLGPSH